MTWTGELLAVETLPWRDAGGTRATLVVKGTFSLATAVARRSRPEPMAPRDRVPFRAGVDVTVEGWARTGAARRLVGVAVSREGEIVWGKRLVRSWVSGEPTWTGLDPEAVPTWDAAAPPPFDGPVERDGGIAFHVAPTDQRLQVLEGGEAVLLMGWGWTDRIVRLPAVVARASAGDEVFGMVADHLHLDLARDLATITWRGLIPAGLDHGRVALLPAADEPFGRLPASWARTPWDPRPPSRPEVIAPEGLAVAPLPTGQVPRGVMAKLTWLSPPAGPAQRLEPQPAIEAGTYDDDDPERELLRPGDLAPTKPEVDVLALGGIYATPGEAAAVARLALGAVDKRVLAVGERRWDGDVATEPEPFERLAMEHRYAFGGPDDPRNPAGTGKQGTPPPRLEDPDRLVRGPDDDAPPACFAPISPSWRDAGITDDRQGRATSMVDDLDPRVWQAAPPDQRCPALRGDEAFVVEGMRPGREAWRGQLPPERPWFFVPEGTGDVRLLDARLDTVVLEPELATVAVQWRASAPQPFGQVAVLLGALAQPPPHARAWGLLAGSRDGRFDGRRFVPWSFAVWEYLLEGAAQEHRSLLRPVPPPPAPVPPPSRAEVEGWAADDALAGRDLARADLRGIQLTGKDLAGSILTGAVLVDAVFEGARLEGANLVGADATGASFVRADLTAADLTDATLEGAQLTRAQLSQACLDRANLRRCDLRRAVGHRLEARAASLEGANLDEADLRGADLTEARLDGAMLARADLTEACLERVDARALVLDEATLDSARFSRARLPRLSAEGASARRSVWLRAAIPGAALVGADLEAAMLQGALVDGADFRRACLRGAIFRDGSLVGARFDGADLMEADRAGADTTGASFAGANLYPPDDDGAAK